MNPQQGVRAGPSTPKNLVDLRLAAQPPVGGQPLIRHSPIVPMGESSALFPKAGSISIQGGAMASSADLVGRTFGRYRIVQPLSGYGMGRAFLARHLSLGTEVLFKAIPARVSADKISFHAFRSVIAGMTRFPHSAIPLVQEVIQEGDLAAYTVPYEPGATLASRLVDGKPLSLPEVSRIFRTVCEALAVVHRAGFVHRAVRPTSILLTQSGAVKLIDFGVQFDFRGLDANAGSSALEAAAYVSPEEAQRKSVGPASDLYSLGATLFAALTGVPPFRGSDPASIVDAHINLPAPTPSNVRSGVPPSLDELTLRLLAKSAGDRIHDAREVAAALDRAVPRGKPTARAVPRPPPRRPVTRRSGGADLASPGPPKRRSGLVPILAILGIVLAAVGVMAGLGGRRVRTPSPPPPVAQVDTSETHYRQFLADAREQRGKGNLAAALGLAQQARAIRESGEVQEMIEALQTEIARHEREDRARSEYEKLMKMKESGADPTDIAFACDEFLRLYHDCAPGSEIRQLREAMMALHRERLAKKPAQPATPAPVSKPDPTPKSPPAQPDPPSPAVPSPTIMELVKARELIGQRDLAGARKLLVEALKQHPEEHHAAIGRELARAILFEEGRWTSRFNGRKLEDDFFPVRLSGSDLKIVAGTNEIEGFSSDDKVAMLMFKKFDPAVDKGLMAEFRLDKRLYESHGMGFRFEVKGGNVYKEFVFDSTRAEARMVGPGGPKPLATRPLGRIGGQWIRLAIVEEGGLTIGFIGGELAFALPVEQFRIAADMRLYMSGCEGRIRGILVRN